MNGVDKSTGSVSNPRPFLTVEIDITMLFFTKQLLQQIKKDPIKCSLYTKARLAPGLDFKLI